MTTERYLMSKKGNSPKESLHYASTPTLFYEETRRNSFNHQQNTLPQAVSQNFLQRKLIHQQHKKFNSTVYLHSSSDTSDNQSSDENSGGLLTLSSQDVRKTETSIKGHKSRIYVCKCMANLYSCPKLNLCQNEDFSINKKSNINWSLKFTGIPALIHDLGNTRSRKKRQIQLCLIEKGTGFVLWKDIVDHLAKYQVSKDFLFHTMHLSADHSQKIGLSFDSAPEAREFQDWLNVLTSDPANISLSGPHRIDPMRAAIIEEAKRQQKKYQRSPDKSDISSPCGFEHLVSIGSRDYTKFFSLQTFVNRNLPRKIPKIHHYGKTRWAPQPPRREVA